MNSDLRRRVGILTLVLAVGSAMTIEAQSTIRLGAQGGLNFAQLGGADAGEPDPLTGWNLGGAALVGRGSLAFMPGLVISRKGAVQSGQGASLKLALTYLQVPALVRVGLSDAGQRGSIGGFAYAGPVFGMKIGCTESGTSGTQTVSVSCDEDTIQFKDSETSAVAGVAAETGALSVALQYELGLSRIAEDLDIKTRTISLVGRYFWGAPRPSRNLMPRRP